jgi:DHA3 family macrolide efflux protein-like MFS transporter
VKNKRAIYSILAANAISGFAQGISMIAIPWYFAHILDDASAFGHGFALITAISLFWSLYSGTLIDKYSRKGIFLVLNAIGFLLLTGFAWFGFYAGGLSAVALLFVFGYNVLNYNIHFPNMYALGQEMLPSKDYGKFSSIMEIQHQVTTVLAGVVAIALIPSKEGSNLVTEYLSLDIQPWTMHEIFLLDGLTYALSFVLILTIKYAPDKARVVQTGSVLSQLKVGFAYLRDNRSVFTFGLASYAVFLILLVHAFYLINIYVNEHLEMGGGTIAFADVCYAFGAILAGIFIRKIFFKTKVVNSVLIMMTIVVAVIGMIALTKFFLFLLFFQFAMGLCNAGIRIQRMTWLFTNLPNEVIGRATSVFNSIRIVVLFVLLELFALTYFSEDSHVTYAYLICGVIVLLAMVPLLKMDKKI